ncbi:hypothetical protein GCM10028786_17440 [Flaviaesturariibacter terrae]
MHENLLNKFDEKTRRGYPLGEVKQDLLELGYTREEAEEFMQALGSRINEKVADKEKNLMSTAALLLFLCGLVLYVFGGRMGLLFMLAGTIWWIVIFFNRKSEPTNAGDRSLR